jgi:hypothetical protein
MSNKNLWRIGADVPRSSRDFLLRRFPPTFDNVHCTALTYAYRVSEDFQYPRKSLDVAIYGYHRFENDHEALLVRVNGQMFRPDGKRFFIALSVAPGVEAVRAAEIDSDSISMLGTEIRLTNILLRRFPLWQRQAEQLRAA